MRKTLAIIGAALLASFGISAAQAKVGDKNWASCVWQSDPSAATKWLELDVPTWQDNMETPSELLGFRLIALCVSTSSDEEMLDKLPKWKSLAKQLSKSKPKAIEQPINIDVDAMRCSSSTIDDDGEERTFLVDIVKRDSQSEVVIFQQYFDFIPQLRKAARIPQGFRVVPKDTSEVQRKCQIINSDGSLSDA